MVARATSDTRTKCPQRSAVRDLNNQSALNLSCNISDVINKNRTTAFNYWDNFSPEAKYFFSRSAALPYENVIFEFEGSYITSAAR